ncbi:hypothetical protein FA10DRAFT_96112 [Acaromyces ingoldii]|uniref:Zn(2)-C6 fungal-type domain-containing protein n=1 Tax=Acaromyces ingoldii TaxID=215250 RepID=A0A316YXQ3_9BASI|nr:hypothetical protein FA10DRAFT_96112 [Acaromyces ingoldii]PWN92595.1 hypothetical protein FA10DRAFT_96112 [Acaromyces ingoldii]
MSSFSPVPRKSHIIFRPTWSCTECARRKVRCDKQIPCQPCVKRGTQDRCSRGAAVDGVAVRASEEGLGSDTAVDEAQVAASQESHEQLTAVVAQLLRRVDRLERQQATSSFSTAPRSAQVVDTAAAAAAATAAAVSAATSSSPSASFPQAESPSSASTIGHAPLAIATTTSNSPASPTKSSLVSTQHLAQEEAHQGNGEETSVTIEYLALGKNRRLGILGVSRDPHTATAPTTNLLEWPHELALVPAVAAMLLPDRALRYILTFHTDAVQWQHACIHSQTFERQAQDYMDIGVAGGPDDDEGDLNDETRKARRWHSVDTLWLALLLSIQTITLHQMPAEDIRSLFPGRKRDALVDDSLAAVRACLDAGDFMRRPNFFACQAIAILSVCGHNVVDSNLLSSLLAVGIKTAQMLNLHVLGAESERVRREVEALAATGVHADGALRRRLVTLEMGKRVWWSLTQQDYFAIPFRGVSLVHPHQHDTPFPSNVLDTDLGRGCWRLLDDSELSLTLKQRITSVSADVLCRFFNALPRSGATLADHVEPYEASLLRLLPSHSQGHTIPRSSDPRLTFGAALARYLNISVRHKMLVVHRAFCGRSPAIPGELQRSQRIAVDLARAILSHCHMGATSTRPGSALLAAMWTTAYHAVAAATVLAMDMLAQPRDRSASWARRREVEQAQEVLRSMAARSPIAARGVSLLTSLLQQHEAGPQARDTAVKTVSWQDEERGRNAPAQKRARLAEPDRSSVELPGQQEEPVWTDAGAGAPLEWDQFQAIVSMLEHVPDMGSLFDGSLGDPFAST